MLQPWGFQAFLKWMPLKLIMSDLLSVLPICSYLAICFLITTISLHYGSFSLFPVAIPGPRQFFTTAKPRMPTKTFFKADNAERLTEKDERTQGSPGFRRATVNNRVGTGPNQFVQKDIDRSVFQPFKFRYSLVGFFFRLCLFISEGFYVCCVASPCCKRLF